jgi:RHS repeat-associated protein
VASISYGYDPNDNITTKTTTGVAGASTNTYTYDQADRLSSWNNGTTTLAYQYDGNGNLTKSGSTTYTYNPKNQLINDGTHAYTYSKRGTLYQIKTGTTVNSTAAYDAFNQAISQGTRSYAYDALGRMVSASGDAAGTATLAYSGAGNTVASDGFATYSWDSEDGLVGVGTSAGNVLAWVDQHDDVVGQFTATGTALSGSATYDPYGTVTATSGMKGNLGYQSGWTDPTTQRVEMGSRWYDPSVGRFISRDKVGLSPVPNSAAANRYAYVDDNPLNDTDPLGTWGLGSLVSAVTSVASSAWNATTSAVSTAYNYASSYAYSAYSYAYSAASYAYSTAVKVTKAVVSTAVRVVRKVAHKVVDAYHAVRRTVSHYWKVAKQVTSRVARAVVRHVRTAVRAVKTAYHAVARAAATVTRTIKNAAVSAAKASVKFVQHHAAAIASIATGVVVFAGCEVVTGGVGSVGCAALAGAAANAVSYGMSCKSSADGCSVLGAAEAVGIGALSGAVGGALGGGAGGKVLSEALGGVLPKVGVRAAVGAISGGAGGAVSGAGDYLTHCGGSGCSASGLMSATAGGAAQGAAIGGIGGALSRGGNGCHSFAPATRVLMSDGRLKPIGEVKLGDKVMATDPATGKTEAKPVVALHHNHDNDLADVTVRIPAPRTSVDQPADRTAQAAKPATMKGGAQARAPNGAARATVAGAAVGTVTVTLHTTWHHPFWNQSTGTWTDAADLKVGDTLHALDTSNAVVVAVQTRTGAADMNDLTVDDTHTYYVVTADTPLLVHNCSATLGRNLRANEELPTTPNPEAHHIVPENHSGAAAARKILKKYDIGIDSHENGVWVSHDTHRGTFTKDYVGWVNGEIQSIDALGGGRQGVLDFLADTKKTLLDLNQNFGNGL